MANSADCCTDSLKYLHLNGEDDGPVQANSLPMSPTSSALDLASLPRGQPRRAPGPITASSTKNDWGSSSINLPRLDKRGNRNISDTTLGLDLRSRNSSPTPSFPNRSRPGSALQNPSNSHNGVLTVCACEICVAVLTNLSVRFQVASHEHAKGLWSCKHTLSASCYSSKRSQP